MPSSQKSQEQAVTEWLLEMYDAGAELRVIQRTSALPNLQTKKRLETALDAASRRNSKNLVINGPDGSPGRVSCVDEQGRLWHRPFDGAFPRRYPKEKAVRQCRKVLLRLLGTDNDSVRNRAFAMLLLADAGLHTFDAKAGRQLSDSLDKVRMNDEMKRGYIVNLCAKPQVSGLLLQRCGLE